MIFLDWIEKTERKTFICHEMMVEPKTHSEIILSGEKKLISKLFPIDKLLKIDWIIWIMEFIGKNVAFLFKK